MVSADGMSFLPYDMHILHMPAANRAVARTE